MKLIKIISSNFFISLIVALIIIYFLPQIFDRYKVKLIEKGTFTDRRVYYYDLDNDGKSESIRFGYRVNPFVVILNNDGGRIMQWNLSGNWVKMSEVTFGDYDNNGFNEIYAFTEYEDSVFCNSLEILTEDSVNIHRKYIASVRKHNNKQDFRVTNCFFMDCNGDNYKEIIFPVNAGFPLQPRNLFAYDIFNDTVYKSPKSGTFIKSLMAYDLNNDGKEEIIADWTWASGNFPVDFPYIDHSAWLMVFNNKLDFVFEPIGFEGYTSSIYALPYRVKDKVYIAALYNYLGKENKKPTLYLYNIKGQKIKERVLKEDKKGRYNIVTINPEKRDELYLTDKDGNIEKLNENLETIKKVNVELVRRPKYMLDVDNDNKKELLFWGNDPEKLIIKRNDYSNIIFKTTPYLKHFEKNIISVKLNGDKPPHLSIQQGDKWFLLHCMKNFLYYLKYLIYLGIYAGVFLFIYLVQKINAYRLEQENKKLEETVKLRTAEINQQKEEITSQRDELNGTNKELEKAFKISSKQQVEIYKKSEILEHQKAELEQKNKDITDSINYAVRIQQAILPTEKDLTGLINLLGLGGYFILFKPRDIVSGDFYWAAKIKNWLIVAAVDCTGHGVPGAFMSMLGVSFLNEIVNKEEITQANQVLNELREYIITSLKQKGIVGEASDGMDMALIVIDTENNMLQFAGANNSLYIVRKESEEVGSQQSAVGSRQSAKKSQMTNDLMTNDNKKETLIYELIEIKGDKMPIGIHEEMKEFANNKIQLHKDDTIYLFSDGYVDQFGGEKEKKFKSKPFKELLLSIQDNSMEEQKEILDKTFDEWKGNLEQVDDVVVIGIRV